MIKQLYTFVVIPCLNEEETLASTCRSLGFGRGISSSPHNTILIIVDNGSTDSTISVAENVKEESAPGSVIIASELVKGYVPPRHHGVEIAEKVSFEQGYSQEEVLILQADADTIYSSNYINSMQYASLHAGFKVLLEAETHYPPSFANEYQVLMNHLSLAEHAFSDLFTQSGNDVIIDDKTCGYRLALYTESGGLQREFFVNGDEIHAGTSRWFMRLRAEGVERCKVETAYVIHSVRKMIQKPLILIANAGFTREASWNNHWELVFRTPSTLKALSQNLNHENLHEALEWRIRNLLALFCLLPRHHARSISASFDTSHYITRYLLKRLPERSIEDAISNPAQLIWDVFNVTDHLEVKLSQPSIDGIPL